MSAQSCIIRPATVRDAPALLEIYAPYVEQTAITFEYTVPSLEDFTDRIRKTLAVYPYLVAQQDGRILGYAYASRFQQRAAYDWAVELSVYIRQDARRLGLGRQLYQALEDVLRAQNVLNVNACIAVPAQPDPYLTDGSVLFHQHMGYAMVGRFHQCGYKFDRWYDMVWMEKALGPHETPKPIRPFPKLSDTLFGSKRNE